MRKLHRGMAAAALSAPLALGLTGVATAAEDEQPVNQASPEAGISVEATAHGGDHGDNGNHYQDDFFGGDYDHHEEDSDGLLGLGLLG